MGRSGHKSPQMRREYIKQHWFKHGLPPTIEHLQAKWSLRRPTLQKDINAVIEEIKDPEVVEHIRSKFLWELNTRLPDMKDVDFVKLTKHFISEKSEVRTDGETTHKVGVEDNLGSFIEEYLPVIVELILDEQDSGSESDTGDSQTGVDTPQTDPETDEVPTVRE